MTADQALEDADPTRRTARKPPAARGLGSAEFAAWGFLDWLDAAAKADGIDHILLAGDCAEALHALAAWRAEASPSAARPALSVLRIEPPDLMLAAATEAAYEAALPALLALAAGRNLAEWLELLGCEAPAEHVLRAFGLAGDAPVPDAPRLRPFLRVWRPKLLRAGREARRRLFLQLAASGLQPGHRLGYVEIGWDGAAQQDFEQALRGVLTLHVTGYYLCLNGSIACEARRGALRMKSLLGPENQPAETIAALDAKRDRIAFLLASAHGAARRQAALGPAPDAAGMAAILLALLGGQPGRPEE